LIAQAVELGPLACQLLLILIDLLVLDLPLILTPLQLVAD